MQKFPVQRMEEHVYSMKTIGYSVFENFLNPDDCKHLKNALAGVIEAYHHDKNHIHDLLAKDILYARLLEDARLQQVVSAVLDDYWILYAFTTSSVPPNGENYGGRIHVDCPRFVENYVFNVGIIWTLDDFTAENGGTRLLPSSHHCSTAPTQEYFEKNAVQLCCKAGSLIVFNARVFHCSTKNMTNQWRHSLTMNACRPFMKQRMDWVRIIPESIVNQLNPQAKRIIGYDTRLPASLEEFFVPEQERLYKAYQE